MSIYLDVGIYIVDDYVVSGYVDGVLATLTGDLSLARIGYENHARGLTAESVVASSASETGPREAPLHPDTFEYWEPTALPGIWRVDLGAARDVDYVGIAGHTIGSHGCSVKVSWSSDDNSYTDATMTVSPSNDSAIFFHFPTISARYWRVTVDLSGSPSSIPRIASIYLGEALVMQRRIYGGHSPITLSRDTVLYQALSRGGQFLGQNYRRRGYVGQATFRHLTPSFYRTSFDPFVKAARRYPYFFAWRPEAYTDEVAYCWTDKDIQPSNMGVNEFMQVSWPMRALGDE